MIELSVNIKGKEKNYPIHINNIDLENLKNTILEEIHYKNYRSLWELAIQRTQHLEKKKNIRLGCLGLSICWLGEV